MDRLASLEPALRRCISDAGGQLPASLDELVPQYVPDRSALRCPYDGRPYEVVRLGEEAGWARVVQCRGHHTAYHLHQPALLRDVHTYYLTEPTLMPNAEVLVLLKARPFARFVRPVWRPARASPAELQRLKPPWRRDLAATASQVR